MLPLKWRILIHFNAHFQKKKKKKKKIVVEVAVIFCFCLGMVRLITKLMLNDELGFFIVDSYALLFPYSHSVKAKLFLKIYSIS